ncbi:MAG: hypothetical protein ACAH88_06055 [Roseimicrobium sp.]
MLYTFVRKRGDAFEHTDFTRHEDGSSGFLADGHYTIFECHSDAWKQALCELEKRGFVELSEARAAGLVPADWLPTKENSTHQACVNDVRAIPDPAT